MNEGSGVFGVLGIPFLFLGLLIVLGIVGSHFAKKAREKRTAELFALSQQLGLDFMPVGLRQPPSTGIWDSFRFGPTEDQAFMQRFEGFTPFGVGHSQDIENLMVGEINGLAWYLFDYSYKITTSNGKTTTTTTHNNVVAVVRLPLLLPDLELSPETFLHRVGNKLGMKELTFEVEEFNRRYFIQCDDAKAAHDILHPRTIEFLMRHPIRHWQTRGLYAMLYERGKRPPIEFLQMQRELSDFVGLIPDYYRQDRGFQATWRTPFD